MSAGAGSEPHDAVAALQAGEQTCVTCGGACADACFSGAIEPTADGSFRIAPEDCAGCGGCVSACAFQKIRLIGGIARLVLDPAAG